ncbi:esterase [Bacillus alveayuensis]|uniref:esterase n=1 Tax=Aeribacillus alveayuensis TaxID=279215 RepID=UPI0005CC9530|nr:esterase [Bacillus alveayuensis]
MVVIQNEKIAHIPVLHVVKEEKRYEKLPLIIFIHGFTSAKEHNLHFGYLLAEAGYRVILPDALYHGEREEKVTEQELQFSFWNIVLNEIEEIAKIKDELASRHIIDEQRIGLAGTSMGGITTFGALTQYPWIKAAVSLMGTPCYEIFFQLQIDEIRKRGYQLPLSEEELQKEKERLAAYDLSLQPEKLKGRPLFIWHGQLDQVVPYHYTYEFYEKIKPLYAQNEAHLKFISDAKAGHKVTREAFLETVNWFEKYV